MDGDTQPPATTQVPPPTGGGPSADERRLRRPTDDRVLFGVASGLARHLGLDPVVVRIAFVLLAVIGGSGLLLYLIGLIAIPEQRQGDVIDAPAGRRDGREGQTVAVAIGGALVVVGTISLLGEIVPGIRELLGPALLLGLGVLVILWGGRR